MRQLIYDSAADSGRARVRLHPAALGPLTAEQIEGRSTSLQSEAARARPGAI